MDVVTVALRVNLETEPYTLLLYELPVMNKNARVKEWLQNQPKIIIKRLGHVSTGSFYGEFKVFRLNLRALTTYQVS